MRVTELWRYPVKSMQGERLQQVEVTELGLMGDRGWAVIDDETGLALTARRRPDLLFGSARVDGPGCVEVRLPDGGDDLSRWLGQPVHLEAARPAQRATYEIADSIDDEANADWVTWSGPEGSFHDSTRARVSLASEHSMAGWDLRRFRANIVVDGGGEADLVGRRVQIGSLQLDVIKGIDRCVITTRPQPGGIDRDLSVLKTINADRGGNLGIGGLVATSGAVSVGDAVTVIG